MNGKRLLLSMLTLVCAVALTVAPCRAQEAGTPKKKGKGKKGQRAPINTLTPQEQAEGWQLLFDGKDLNGWRGLNAQGEPANFKVEQGLIHKIANKKIGADLMTEKTFNNFELSFEWKVAPAANNGVKYNVSEELSAGKNKKGHAALGFEYQVLDDDKAGDRLDAKHRCGALYELKAPDDSKKKLKPVGQWNQSKIVYNGNHIEHWLNGQKIVEAELGSPEMNEALAKSKWNKIKDEFGKRRTDGHIVIQDHIDECWYRNIKIRELPSK